jgi:predicted acetyltransferase
MEQLKLIVPTVGLAAEHQLMLNEWLYTGERMVPYTLQGDTSNFSRYIGQLKDCEKGIGVPDGFVPSSTFWLVNSENEILGTVNIRHRLSESLMIEGGHIGYGVKPSERKKGYATKMLTLALLEAKKLGIEKAFLTCDKDNVASTKVILKNGGSLYRENVLDGISKLSFWIELP